VAVKQGTSRATLKQEQKQEQAVNLANQKLKQTE
jgi:hypothetical protein